MKNEDILLIKKMIKYCDDIGTLMTKFDMDLKDIKRIFLFNTRAICVLFKLENLLIEYQKK